MRRKLNVYRLFLAYAFILAISALPYLVTVTMANENHTKSTDSSSSYESNSNLAELSPYLVTSHWKDSERHESTMEARMKTENGQLHVGNFVYSDKLSPQARDSGSLEFEEKGTPSDLVAKVERRYPGGDEPDAKDTSFRETLNSAMHYSKLAELYKTTPEVFEKSQGRPPSLDDNSQLEAGSYMHQFNSPIYYGQSKAETDNYLRNIVENHDTVEDDSRSWTKEQKDEDSKIYISPIYYQQPKFGMENISSVDEMSKKASVATNYIGFSKVVKSKNYKSIVNEDEESSGECDSRNETVAIDDLVSIGRDGGNSSELNTDIIWDDDKDDSQATDASTKESRDHGNISKVKISWDSGNENKTDIGGPTAQNAGEETAPVNEDDSIESSTFENAVDDFSGDKGINIQRNTKKNESKATVAKYAKGDPKQVHDDDNVESSAYDDDNDVSGKTMMTGPENLLRELRKDHNFLSGLLQRIKMSKSKLEREEESQEIIKDINFPHFYHATGFISLPYDDIVEPFEAWYAGKLNMSRIDYYYGMDKSYQRGDIGKHGVLVKIVPVHWSKKGPLDKNKISCWYREETKWNPQRGQSVIPLKMKKFKFIGEEMFNGVPAYKLRFKKHIEQKDNIYTFYVTKSKPHRPLRYEMLGYDHLLRSHYDSYVLDYVTFEEWEFDFKKLQIPKEFRCYKKLKKLKSRFEANPMFEFMHDERTEHREKETKHMFKKYVKKHGKNYKSDHEHARRRNLFRHNARFIHSKNRANLNYTLAINHLADLTNEEFQSYKGLPDNFASKEIQKELEDIPRLRFKIPKEPLPDKLDWRKYGAVNKVRSQSFCAACWSFSAAGVIEGAYKIQKGISIELSTQQLIDCTWGYGNNGCRGGFPWRALNFVREHGLVTRESYGKYLGQEGYCHCDKQDNCTNVGNITYRTIEKHHAKKLKVALAKFGPGSISVHCDKKSFKFYSSGIYDDSKCKNNTDHAVLVIGYGTQNGIGYWLIKNSWGTLWGEKGFIKISMKKDLCGVLRNGALVASFVDWKQADSKGFPFKTMKEIDYQEEIGGLKEPHYTLREGVGKIDFYTAPKDVTNYQIEQMMRKKHRR